MTETEGFRPTRRAFLGGVLALMATPVIAKALPEALAPAPLPIIRGDGKYDDWAGLQALFRGEAFEIEAEAERAFTATAGLLTRGTFRVSQTLLLPDDSFVIRSCRFIREVGEEKLFEFGNGFAPLLVQNTETVIMDPLSRRQVSGWFTDEWKA